MLESLDRELNAQGVNVAFVELRDRLQDLLLRYGLLATLDHDHFYPSISLAFEAIANEDHASDRSTGETNMPADDVDH